ncbi:MAG: T9SS type A sorting domain-containing protein, partial [Flavobacteriales bacterium]|nr:T9SS type A sorting domain-containing protein [Flavobacteriales bacterium]
MKSIFFYLMVAAVSLGAGTLQAQNCPTEVNTDPRNPSNPDRPELANQFFWFPHNGQYNANFELITPGGTYPSINSPFWSVTDLMVGQLVNLGDSDFYPEDGWELLKVNFGRLNDGTQRTTLPNMPYMTLYNKYTGTLRFLGMWPNASTSWEIIRFKVSLPQTRLGDQSENNPLDATNLLSIQGDAAQPLDQQTEENVYEIITDYPGISNASYFFWFDLPVAYDPCICNSDVAIRLEASVESNWNVTVKGIVDAQVLQQGAPASPNHSALVIKRIMAANSALAVAIASGGTVVQTGPIIDLIDIFQERPGASQQAQSNLALFESAIRAGSNVAWDETKMEWRNIDSGETISQSEWNAIVNSIGPFQNAAVDYFLPSQKAEKPRTSVVGSITASGTATLNQMPGDLVYWGLPGSAWTGSLEESVSNSTLGSGLDPEYPIYNNPLGTFALLKTPTIQVKKISHSILDGYQLLPPFDESTCMFGDYTEIQAFFNQEEFKYYFNPAMKMNQEKTEILASIVIKEKNNGAGSPFVSETQCLTDNFSSPSDEIYCNLCISEQDVSIATNLLQGSNIVIGVDDKERYTPPVPIDYINDMVASFLTNNQTSINDFDFFIRLTLKIESHNVGKDGDPVKNTQVITFPLNAVEYTGTLPIPIVDLENDVNEYTIIDTSVDLPTDEEHFNSGYTEISSNLFTSTGVMGTILSGSVIHLKPGAVISPNIRLAIDYPLQGTQLQGQCDEQQISDFCSNQLPDLSYQASTFSAKAYVGTSLPNHTIKPYLENAHVTSLNLHPNPARSELTLRGTGGGLGHITIYDTSGRPVMQANAGGGASEHRMDIGALAPGIYIVQATCGDE